MTTVFPAKVKENNGISYFPGFIGDVDVAKSTDDGETTDLQLSLWKDEGKPPEFVLSGYSSREDSYAGISLTPDQIDEICAQLQKAKELLLEALEEFE